MVGCEADGALFAVSRMHLSEGVAPETMQAQWQAATLQQMRAKAEEASSYKMTGAKRLPMAVVVAQGQRADGKPIKANLAWVVVGEDLVHLAVYAEQLTQEHTEPFMDGVHAP